MKKGHILWFHGVGGVSVISVSHKAGSVGSVWDGALKMLGTCHMPHSKQLD